MENPPGKNGDDAGGEMSLVEMSPTARVLRISVRGGQNPAKLLRMIVDTFELLVSKWYNIKTVKRYVINLVP